MSPIIRLDGVSLRYRLAKQRAHSLKEYAIHWMKGGLVYEDLWALRDVSFEVGRGESVGVVGRNGAGKSTLLKVLCGVLEPTRGSARLAGRVAPILALGAGFDHELTGLENVYLNALLLGRSRREIAARAGHIVEFSGLGDLIRAPIRSYSAGMIVRLGFAVATAWRADILVLDEVLGVGDAAFVKRCEARLAELRRDGATVVLASHVPDEILANCDRCLWLEAGRIAADGEPRAVLDAYASTRFDGVVSAGVVETASPSSA
ncbi:MAG: ABC transporter ATP-binding protein [Deltaproteobacteria bacterium]|jgi:ABC-2 type transport system ATP-binding protein|nr:ABC transporter ATP-binding protein [Deltaproteobacteria bacterium]